MRFRAGCSMLGTLTMLAKVLPAVRFCTPGSEVPTPEWQPEQIGVNICACSCVSVTCGGGGALFATVTTLALELPTLPSASVAVAVRLNCPSTTLVVSH